jgi:aspartyl-tRNA(Asn)/glutamyl-tRNA(Gln) amidotransferase subunit A
MRRPYAPGRPESTGTSSIPRARPFGRCGAAGDSLRSCVVAEVGTTLTERSATELARAIAARETSSEEVVRAHLARIDALNPRLNAIVCRLDEEALAEARRADAELARGARRGPLHGVPVTLKESLAMAGKVTSCGSTVLQANVTPEDATAVARIRRAGAIPIGRTNVPDMGMDAQTHNLVWGTTRNPWNLAFSPGGSSGGEGAAIAARLSPLGLGSDVAGSIRIPAAFCGILGLKPTQHRVSIEGHVPLVLHDYLQIGPLARSVDDLEVALAAIAGPDGKQSLVPPVPLAASAARPATPLRIGVVDGSGLVEIGRAVRAGVARVADAAARLGHHVERAELAAPEEAVLSLTRIFAVGLTRLRSSIAANPAAFHPYLHRLLTQLAPPTTEELDEAFALREAVRQRMMACCERHDVILAPLLGVPGVPIGTADEIDVDGVRVPFVATLGYSVLVNATGNPSLVVPTGVEGGLPVGVQLIGRMWDEPTLFSVARPLVEALGGVPRPTGLD